MADRISSDHPSVQTFRATCAETATGVTLEVPADAADVMPTDEVVRIVLDETELFATVERALTGEQRVIRGIYETPDAARDPSDETDRLAAWADDHGIQDGASALLDVVEPEFAYGLREPGATAYYDAYEPPSNSLQDIAGSLEDAENS